MSIATTTAPKTTAAPKTIRARATQAVAHEAIDARGSKAEGPRTLVCDRRRPLIRQTMTVQSPFDEGDLVTIEVVVLAKTPLEEEELEHYAEYSSQVPELATIAGLRQAGWQGYGVNDLDVFWRIIPGS